MRAGTVVVVILAIVGAIFLGIVGLGGALVWIGVQAMEPPEDITYTLTGPTEIRVGEPATFLVEVTNTSDTDSQTLYSVDLYTELTDHGAVELNPVPPSQNDAWGYTELLYQKTLAPGATEQIEVTFHPDRAGRYTVNIDVCIGHALSFIERYHDLQVLEAEQATAGP